MRISSWRLLLPALALSTSLQAGCSPVYVARAAIEEAKILSRRRPITEVLADENTQDRTRAKLNLVLQARNFAERELDLDVGESFTTYSWVESDTLLMVLSAARKDRFQQHTWWFPIVGHVPYKGYFNFDQAYAAAAALDRAGYDTYVRPSGAFSTLGFFNDPLLNTVLRYGDVSLASTVIHELLHNTVFVPSQVAFNESLANFVGDRGAATFFCTRDGESSAPCKLARDAWNDNLVYSEFLGRLIADLEELYARPGLNGPDRVRLRETVYQESRARFQSEARPRLRTNMFLDFTDEPLNNASLIATRLYYDRLQLFEDAYQRHHQDLRATITFLVGIAKAHPNDPFGALTETLTERSR
ncbi:MAG: aminopeptidase [Longimicrobiales bacterium]